MSDAQFKKLFADLENFEDNAADPISDEAMLARHTDAETRRDIRSIIALRDGRSVSEDATNFFERVLARRPKPATLHGLPQPGLVTPQTGNLPKELQTQGRATGTHSVQSTITVAAFVHQPPTNVDVNTRSQKISTATAELGRNTLGTMEPPIGTEKQEKSKMPLITRQVLSGGLGLLREKDQQSVGLSPEQQGLKGTAIPLRPTRVRTSKTPRESQEPSTQSQPGGETLDMEYRLPLRLLVPGEAHDSSETLIEEENIPEGLRIFLRESLYSRLCDHAKILEWMNMLPSDKVCVLTCCVTREKASNWSEDRASCRTCVASWARGGRKSAARPCGLRMDDCVLILPLPKEERLGKTWRERGFWVNRA